MKFRETMRGEMSPDIYDGDNCDEHRPRWYLHCEGDMDSDYLEEFTLTASTFPPGTKISIQEPICPKCETVPTLNLLKNIWQCECDFDWKSFAEDRYS